MALAEEMAKLFVEAIAAPSFSEEAKARLSAKKNLRLLVVKQAAPGKVVKQISGGLLLQDADDEDVAAGGLKVVTVRQPTTGGDGGASFCLASGQARQVERHRVCPRWPDDGSGRGPDEPGGCGEIRRHESGVAAGELRGRL